MFVKSLSLVVKKDTEKKPLSNIKCTSNLLNRQYVYLYNFKKVVLINCNYLINIFLNILIKDY